MTSMVAYVASRNPQSQTLRSVRLIQDAVSANIDAEWTILTPNDTTILPSDGTASEFSTGVDHIELNGLDDSARVKKAIERCDYLILGSPTYGHNVSGDMKILMDRLTYWGHLFHLASKPGMAMVSATTNGFLEVGELMERFMESLGIIIDETAYHTTFTPFDEAMADQTAAAIVRALNTLRDGVVPETSERQELAFQSYKRDYARRDGSDAESRYWRERGMFDCATFHEYVETRRKLPESVHAER